MFKQLCRGVRPVMDVLIVCARNHQRSLVLVAALALGSCATVSAPPPPGYDELFALAGDLVQAGRTQAALDAYRGAAMAAPSRKEPWQKIAVINFEAGRPVRALVAAEETLQRDPADAVASEVYIASGMQVAQHAIQRLLAAGAKHDDDDLVRAQELVAKMAQVFGHEALVPDEAKARYARRAVQQYRAAQARQAKSRAPEESKPAPDPFEVLGGD